MKTRTILTIAFSLAIAVQGIGQLQEMEDTLVLKTGEIISCSITYVKPESDEISIRILDSNHVFVSKTFAFHEVETYIISSLARSADRSYRNFNPALQDSLKRIKAYCGFGFGIPKVYGISVTLILKNNFGTSFSYKYTDYDRKDRSNKTHPAFSTITGQKGTDPGDHISEINFCAIKEFPNKNNIKIRCGLEAGPSIVIYDRLESKHLVNNSSLFVTSIYYKTEYRKFTTIGLCLRAKLEFPLTLAFGFEIAAYANINKHRSHAGLEIYLTLGKLRDRTIPKSIIHKN